MTKRLATALSIATVLSLGAVSTTALAQQQAPVSSMSESSAPASSAAGAAATGTAAPAAAAGSQAAPAAVPPAAGTTAAQNVSDDQLRKFVASAQQVAVLSQQYSKQLEGVTDQAAQQEVVQKANQDMAQAVQSNGLSIQEFNSISDAVDRDPALQQRAQQMVQ